MKKTQIVKKLAAWLLSLVVLVGLTNVMALDVKAEDGATTGISIYCYENMMGKFIVEEGTPTGESVAGASYNAETNTLQLSGYQGFGVSVSTPGADFKISVNGTNASSYVSVVGSCELVGDGSYSLGSLGLFAGIDNKSDLTLNGPDVTLAGALSIGSFGTYSQYGQLIFKSGSMESWNENGPGMRIVSSATKGSGVAPVVIGDGVKALLKEGDTQDSLSEVSAFTNVSTLDVAEELFESKKHVSISVDSDSSEDGSDREEITVDSTDTTADVTSKANDAIDKLDSEGTLAIAGNKDVVVEKEVLESLKEKDLKLEYVYVDDEGAKTTWTFASITATTKDFNPVVAVGESVKAIDEKLADADQKYLTVKFDHEGNLPGEAEVTIELTDEQKKEFPDGTKLFLYYFNEKTGLFEKKLEEAVTVADGKVTFKISHCSSYILTDKQLASSLTETTKSATTKNASSDVKTGDTAKVGLLLVVVLLALVAIVVVLIKKRKTRG